MSKCDESRLPAFKMHICEDTRLRASRFLLMLCLKVGRELATICEHSVSAEPAANCCSFIAGCSLCDYHECSIGIPDQLSAALTKEESAEAISETILPARTISD